MTKRSRVNDAWWEEPTTLPVAENIPLKARRRRARFITVYIWAAAVLLPLTLLSTLVLTGQLLTERASTAEQVDQAAVTPETAQAQLAVETWIARTPSPLPGGRVLAFSGATTVAPEVREGEAAPDYTLTTYTFLLTDDDRSLYTSSIQMAVSPTTGAVPVATPALLPHPRSSARNTAKVWPWPGVEQGERASAYQTAVTAWARAYSSGDPAALKQAVGDPEDGRGYLPMSGVTLGEASVVEVGNLWGEDQDRAEDPRPAQALIRSSVTVQWDGQEQSKKTTTTAPTMTFDLLLDRTDTASPVVVAWGSPGTALTPYGNAVPEAQIDLAAPAPKSDRTPIPSPSPTS